jgi:NitT/TauT family transport system permease protein
MTGPALLVLFVLVWEFLLRVLSVPAFLVPTPSAVARALYVGFVVNPLGSGSYLAASLSTYVAALMAFGVAAILGVALALLLSQSARVEETFMPYIVGFQTLPRIAIAPLFIIWFGNGTLAKTVLATVVAFFPVLINALVGLTSVPRNRLELMRALRATRWQTFWLVQLPGSLPYIFAGLDVALVFSILGVLVAEFVGGQDGLGVLILQAHFTLDVAGVFAIFVILIVIGLALRGLLQVVRRRLLFWSDAQSGRIL